MPPNLKSTDKSMIIFYFVLNCFISAVLTKYSSDLLFGLYSMQILSALLFFKARADPGLETVSDEEEAVEGTFCSDCSLTVQMRTKHCKKCGVCIRKFDHHCFLIAACVGEKNHFDFWVYVVVQSLTLILGSLRCFWLMDGRFAGGKNVPMGLTLCSLFLGGYLLITVYLSFYHFYLIGSNQTGYEDMKDGKIGYIAEFKKERKKIVFEQERRVLKGNHKFLPFDLGFWMNFKIVYRKERMFYHNQRLENHLRAESSKRRGRIQLGV